MKKFFFTAFIISLFIISPVYALPPGGGAENFTELDDAPTTYTGQTGKYVKVRVDETGLEFGVPPGGGDMLAATFDADSNDAIDLNRGGTNAALTDPNADRILFWDDSAGAVTWLTPGNGFLFSTTTLNLDFTPSSGSATIQWAHAAIEVKYDTSMFGEGANGLELDITPSAGNATLIVEEDALQVKYDTTLTEGVNGLGVSNTLTNNHLAANAAIAFSKLANLTSAHILVGSAGNVATSVAVSGDVTMANTGGVTMGANKVTGTHMSLTSEATGALQTY